MERISAYTHYLKWIPPRISINFENWSPNDRNNVLSSFCSSELATQLIGNAVVNSCQHISKDFMDPNSSNSAAGQLKNLSQAWKSVSRLVPNESRAVNNLYC